MLVSIKQQSYKISTHNHCTNGTGNKLIPSVHSRFTSRSWRSYLGRLSHLWFLGNSSLCWLRTNCDSGVHTLCRLFGQRVSSYLKRIEMLQGPLRGMVGSIQWDVKNISLYATISSRIRWVTLASFHRHWGWLSSSTSMMSPTDSGTALVVPHGTADIPWALSSIHFTTVAKNDWGWCWGTSNDNSEQAG